MGYGAFFPGELNGILARCEEQATAFPWVSQLARRVPAGLRLEEDPAAVSRWRLASAARVETYSVARASELAAGDPTRPVIDAAEVLREGERATAEVAALLAALPGTGRRTVARIEETAERLVTCAAMARRCSWSRIPSSPAGG